MTYRLMKSLAPSFSIVGAVAFGACLISGFDMAWAAPAPAAPLLPTDMVTAAARVSAYPSFCDIPERPANVRSAEAYRALVVRDRLAGAHLVALTAPSTFSLSDTDSFAAAARAWAAPPPPMPSDDAAEAEAFAKTARERVLPPRRP